MVVSLSAAESFQRQHDLLPSFGGTITIPAGVHVVDSTVTFTKPVRVVGDPGAVVRAGSGELTTVFRVYIGGEGSVFERFRLEGAKSAAGGAVHRGIQFDQVARCRVEGVTFSGPTPGTGFSFGVDVNTEYAHSSQIRGCRFERLVSSTGNGTAILIAGASSCVVADNEIDGVEFGNHDGFPGAAIFLAGQVARPGASDCLVRDNVIRRHPQVGIAVNSTTYVQFGGTVGECTRNRIEDNLIEFCGGATGGDGGSGIAVVGTSTWTRIARNTIRSCGHATTGGFGVVIAGCQQGNGQPGTPKRDEAPTHTQIRDNEISYCKDDGIRIKGAVHGLVFGNTLYENGQRQASVFRNVRVSKVGGSLALGSYNRIVQNSCVGAQVGYQIEIGEGVTDWSLDGNYVPAGSLGSLLGCVQ
jgi:hypothetical protein